MSSISKRLEKIIHAKLSTFLSTSNVLYEKQFGFQNHLSTNRALIELTENIKRGCDSGKFACGVFLGFQKTFDTVLFKKLEYYGIRDKSNKWFRSFLEDRKQHTTINKARLSNTPTSIGVPQGSILGPIFFAIFINEFHKATEFSTVHHLQMTPISCLLKTH